MTTTLKRFVASAVFAAGFAATAFAATDEAEKARAMLFDVKHIASIAAGTELKYKFERLPSDEKLLGPGYTDDMKIKIESDGAPGKKNIAIQVFSGERARDPQKITDMDGNPMVVIFLDNSVGHYMQLSGGDRAYLKNKFSKTLGDASKLTAVKIDYKGTMVDGFRISVSPYADDPQRAKMRGFETAEFTIALSDKIPGYLAQMIANYTNTDKTAPTLVEKTTLDGVGEVK